MEAVDTHDLPDVIDYACEPGRMPTALGSGGHMFRVAKEDARAVKRCPHCNSPGRPVNRDVWRALVRRDR